MAVNKGIDLAQIRGSGADGIITSLDVDKFSRRNAPKFTDTPAGQVSR